MSEAVLNYFNQLDTLNLSDLEILADKINTLISNKRKSNKSQIEAGIAYFNSIRGSVKRDINVKEELAEALDEKYAHIN